MSVPAILCTLISLGIKKVPYSVILSFTSPVIRELCWLAFQLSILRRGKEREREVANGSQALGAISKNLSTLMNSLVVSDSAVRVLLLPLHHLRINTYILSMWGFFCGFSLMKKYTYYAVFFFIDDGW